MAMFTGSPGEFFRMFLTAQPYKPGQGNLARNTTLMAALVVVAAGVYSWSRVAGATAGRAEGWMQGLNQYGLPTAVGGLVMWICYRLVNYPRFADFLIATEAEMNKVQWPSWQELKTSTIVVVLMVILVGLFLFGADVFWRFLLQALGILKISGLMGGGSANS